jgi:uncharacterized protein
MQNQTLPQLIKPHTILQTILLHLFPGVLITAFYYILAPYILSIGFPVENALLLAILFILAPIQLSYLFYQGYKKSSKITLKDIVLYRESMPLWQYFVIVPLILIWAIGVFVIMTPVDNFIIQNYFGWLTSFFIPSQSLNLVSQYSRPVLLITIGLNLVLNGIVGPVVEELYFRGYLLPRIPASRIWSPLISVILFSLYHFFSPWQNITRIIALIPMIYAVSWKRNIYLSIFAHCLLNILGAVALLLEILK